MKEKGRNTKKWRIKKAKEDEKREQTKLQKEDQTGQGKDRFCKGGSERSVTEGVHRREVESR